MNNALLAVVCLLLSLQSTGQPASGLAPDFTLRDLNGNWHSLYDYLDQGKTVFIEFSAAWCQPCWNFHNSGTFKDLYQQHGPAGYPGVNANTTDDVMVFFIEGEPDNTVQQLYGVQGTGSSQTTMGNWVSGTPFPIIDTNAAMTNALMNAWGVGSFPTIMMICRDRLVYKYSQQPASQLYSAVQFTCPAYPPAATVDAKAVYYRGHDYFFCNPAPELRFQNYSTNTLNSATIRIFNNSTQVHSYNWNGNLAPYQIADVMLPPFAVSLYSGYRFEIDAAGDVQPANNKSRDSLFWVYSAGNAESLPVSHDFDYSPLMPHKFRASDFGTQPTSSSFNTTPVVYVKGVNGQNTRAMRFRNRLAWWYEQQDLIAGNYDLQTAGSVLLEFDVAFAQYDGNEKDTMEVLLSNDCGQSWQTAWLKSGADLATHPPVGNFTDFYPQAASHWRHEIVDLTPYKGPNTIVMFKMRCNKGNDAWVDNIEIHQTNNITAPGFTGSFSLFPNPANDRTQLTVEVPKSSKAEVVISSADGRVVSITKEISLTAGTNNIGIPVNSLPAGVYLLTLTTDGQARTLKLLVGGAQ